MMIIKENDYNCDRLQRGDRLLIGNGCYGYRGTLEENIASDCVALNAACFYDQNGNNWRETVNMPNPLYCKVFVNGQELCADNAKNHVESLNLANGHFSRKTTFRLGEITASIESVRFFVQTSNSLLVSQLMVQCSAPAALKIVSGIDCDVWNISGEHFVVDKFIHKPLTVFATTNENKKLAVEVREQASQNAQNVTQDQNKLCNNYELNGQTFTVTKFCRMSHDDLPWQDYIADFALLKEQNEQWWKDKWKHSRVVLGCDSQIQLATDYSIYQLIIYAPKAENMSIGARGLSGQTYKGAIFWDTEMFMLPFYLQTDTQTAKRLVRYRINTLSGAKQKAQNYGYQGAFFAWESQDGYDACSDFNITDVFTGRPVRTYFKDKQIHISADIAVALWNTYQKTKDLDLLTQGGAELLVECALFYISYAYFNENKNRYELLSVIGPDEYHEQVNNNAYTNYMAYECVDIVQKVIKILYAKAPISAIKIIEKYGDQLKRLEKFKKLLYLPQPNEKGVIEQFDGYFKLEDVSVQTVRSRLVHPQEYWGGSGGVATATRVIKQADVVALMCVLPHRFSREVMQANYNFYLPYTEHGSTLSASMYSQCACLIGKPDDAYLHFVKSATIDLVGGGKSWAGKTYIGGTHPAACGGAWLTVFNGFASHKDGSSLPQQISSVKISLEKGSIAVDVYPKS